MPIDFAALTEPTWVETDGLGTRFDFGCDPLAPADFDAHASTLFGLVAGLNGDDKPSREPAAADLQHLQIIACLTVSQMRQPDSDAVPVRLVLAKADENIEVDPKRVWVGRLPLHDVGTIAGVGIGSYAEAAARAVRFRERSKAAASTGRDGETLRPDSESMDRAAG